MWTIFTEGVLKDDFSVAELKQVDHISFDAGAVGSGSGKCGLHHSLVSATPALGIQPLSIGNGLPGGLEGFANGLLSLVARAAGIWPRNGFKYAVFMHERHQSVDIMTIP